MSLKKDKQKVLGEIFDDERVKGFLDVLPPEGISADYNALEKAYRGMNIDNFITFIQFFNEAGRDINATNPQGKTILQIIEEHRHGSDYANALRENGAQ